jgi:hypothetical protein
VGGGSTTRVDDRDLAQLCLGVVRDELTQRVFRLVARRELLQQERPVRPPSL